MLYQEWPEVREPRSSLERRQARPWPGLCLQTAESLSAEAETAGPRGQFELFCHYSHTPAGERGLPGNVSPGRLTARDPGGTAPLHGPSAEHDLAGHSPVTPQKTPVNSCRQDKAPCCLGIRYNLAFAPWARRLGFADEIATVTH